MRASMILGAALALVAATPAMATDPFDVTFTGTVTKDYYSGFLGDSKSAVGMTFSETFTVYLDNPYANITTAPGLLDAKGAQYTNPVVLDSLAIDGVTKYGGCCVNNAGEYETLSNYSGNMNEIYTQASDDDGSPFHILSAYSYIQNSGGSSVTPAPFSSYSIQAGDTSYGVVGFFNHGYLTLAPDGVRFSSYLPETSTWAMMLAGFGAIGFVMRRRRSIRDDLTPVGR